MSAATLSSLNVPGVAEAVADKVQREQGGHQDAAGKEYQPPVDADGIDLADPFGDQGSPTGHGGLNTHTEVTQERFVENNSRHGQGEISDDNTKCVGNDVTGKNPSRTRAKGAAGFDKCARAQR